MRVWLAVLSCAFLASAAGWCDVPEPWMPVAVKGHTVACWGREYRFGAGSVMPESILTQGKDMLAGLARVDVSAGGRKLDWRGATFRVLEKSRSSALYETSAAGPGLSVRCRFYTEFDGVTRVDMALLPKRPMQLDSVDLVIPLKRDLAELFHHSPTYPVHVWDWPLKRLNAGSVPADGMRLPFVFHLWLGNDDLGLQVFSESDEPWQPADADSAMRVACDGKTTELRMNLLSRFELSEPWEWSFGFVGTPVRPWPKDYYRLHYSQMGGYGVEKSASDGQPSYLDVQAKMGVNWLGFHENWSDEQSLPRPKEADKLRSLVDACHARDVNLAVYTGCYMSTRSPEYHKEWDSLPIGDHYQYQRPDNGDICRIICNNTRYAELLPRLYREGFAEFGLDGLYLDGLTCPLPCTNVKHGCGYVGRDGQVHPTMPIWRTRQLMKRLHKIVKDRPKPGIIVAHTSSSILLPALSFADFYLDGEHLLAFRKIGSADYPEDILRAEMSGHNFGIPATQLPIRGSDTERERARTICALHDILWFWHPDQQADIWKAWDNFGVSGAKWMPYWRASSVVETDGPVFRVSAYSHRGRGVLLVVANLGESQSTARVRVKRAGLGIAKQVRLGARDECSGDDLTVENDTVSVEVKAGAFRMISVAVR